MTTSVLPAARSMRAAHRALGRPPLRRWWTDAVGLTVWASVLVVVALWESHGGVQAFADGSGEALTTFGRLTGLLSADLLLWQVLTMARIPWVERSIGQDRLTRWHRVLGFTSVNLLAVHIAAITLGYAALNRTGVLGEAWSLVTTAPGMLLATAGTALLVGVTVLSVRAARRRARYESWHLLHLYAYLGVGLAVPHQLWTGADFISSPVATAYWWTLWAVAAASVLVFRVVQPLRLSRRHDLVVRRITAEAPGVVSVHVTGRRLADLRVAAGQFFVWRFRTGPGWTRGHPLSLSDAPTTNGLRITLSTKGDDGARLATMRPGTRVLIEGPHGRLTPEVRTRPGLALIGSGLGVAPLIAVLRDAILNDAVVNDGIRSGGSARPVTLVRRVHTGGPQPFDRDLEKLTQAGLVTVVDVVGPRSTTGTPWLPADAGHVPGPDALRSLVPDLDGCDLYVCGAAPWAKAVAADARAAGVPSTALHVEHFTW